MSFKLCQQGEKCVQKLLKKFDLECQINEDYKKRYDYDLVSDYKNKKVTYEFKYDYMGEKTGNPSSKNIFLSLHINILTFIFIRQKLIH